MTESVRKGRQMEHEPGWECTGNLGQAVTQETTSISEWRRVVFQTQSPVIIDEWARVAVGTWPSGETVAGCRAGKSIL